MIQIDMGMPENCCECWIRLSIGCQIANASGWLTDRRDEMCPLIEAPNNGGWISVKEKLPCPFEPVEIATDALNGLGEEFVSIGCYEHGAWKCLTGPMGENEHVTHWKPLPEPPKEET